MAARLGFSTGKGKIRRQRVRNGTEALGVSRAPRPPSPSSKKMQGEGFGNRWAPPSRRTVLAEAAGCRRTVKFAPCGIIRSIMNESCHRRYFLLGWPLLTLLPGNAPCDPSLSFLLACEPVVRVCIAVVVMCEVGVITLQCLGRVLRHTL